MKNDKSFIQFIFNKNKMTIFYSQNYKNLKNINNKKELDLCHKSAKKLKNEISSGLISSIDVAMNDDDILELENIAKEITKSFKKILVLGVGGSSLGGKTFLSLTNCNKIEFLESIDPNTINNFIKTMNVEETFILVISKSGETIETICQTMIFVDLFKKEKIKNLGKRFLFITEKKSSTISKIAKEIKAKTLDHQCDIGGRYSCFSLVGILPAIIAGCDPRKIRNGARICLENFFNNDDIIYSCSIQLALYQNKITNNVMMPYVDNMKNFNDWYRQLLAESLGKNGFGITPINSMGTVDQHSQLQLYLDGKYDKFFTFIILENYQNNFLLKDINPHQTIFGRKYLSDILAIEAKTTIEVLDKKKLPIRIFTIKDFNEEVLGCLMMQMFLEVIIIGYTKNINPFDQEAIEIRKNLAKYYINNISCTK